MFIEKSQTIKFDGWVIDLFNTEKGSLGITVERLPESRDSKSVDIYVTDNGDGSLRVGANGHSI